MTLFLGILIASASAALPVQKIPTRTDEILGISFRIGDLKTVIWNDLTFGHLILLFAFVAFIASLRLSKGLLLYARVLVLVIFIVLALIISPHIELIPSKWFK